MIAAVWWLGQRLVDAPVHTDRGIAYALPQPPASCGQQPKNKALAKFLSQRCPVNAENFRRRNAIVAGAFENGCQQCRLDVVEELLIEIVGGGLRGQVRSHPITYGPAQIRNIVHSIDEHR